MVSDSVPSSGRMLKVRRKPCRITRCAFVAKISVVANTPKNRPNTEVLVADNGS